MFLYFYLILILISSFLLSLTILSFLYTLFLYRNKSFDSDDDTPIASLDKNSKNYKDSDYSTENDNENYSKDIYN